MSVNQDDLDSFHDFATNLLSDSGSTLSLEEMIKKWRDERELSATIASVRRGIADVEEGRLRDFAGVDERIRSELGFRSHR
jgi:hypothetical protein